MRNLSADKLKNKTSYAAWALAASFLSWGGINTTWAQVSDPSTLEGTTDQPVQEARQLTMQAAVQQAVNWYPSIAETLGRLYQQNEQVAVARSGALPQVNAGLSSEYRTSSSQTEEAFNITASQMLYDFGKVENEVKAELFGVERDQARVLLAIDQLALEVA